MITVMVMTMVMYASKFFVYFSGRIKHTEVCELLKQMLPPVGLGTKCPKVIAYKVSLCFLYISLHFLL